MSSPLPVSNRDRDAFKRQTRPRFSPPPPVIDKPLLPFDPVLRLPSLQIDHVWDALLSSLWLLPPLVPCSPLGLTLQLSRPPLGSIARITAQHSTLGLIVAEDLMFHQAYSLDELGAIQCESYPDIVQSQSKSSSRSLDPLLETTPPLPQTTAESL